MVADAQPLWSTNNDLYKVFLKGFFIYRAWWKLNFKAPIWAQYEL